MDLPILKLGSQGIHVRRLQTILKALKYNIAIDGDFGRGTLGMVKMYQTTRGLVSDGFVGGKTWKQLLKDESRVITSPTPKANYEYKRLGSTHYVELNPLDIKLHMENTTGSRITLSNFMNASFVWWEDYPKNTKPFPTSILVYDGKIVNNKQPNGFWSGEFKGKGVPTPTFIIYKDGRIIIEDKNYFTVFEANNIHLAVSGISIKPNLRNTGFHPYVPFSSVAYQTKSIAIGYNPNSKKLILAYHPSTTAGGMGTIMGQLGCTLSIRLDSGGSANYSVNGNKINGTTRPMSAWLTW